MSSVDNVCVAVRIRPRNNTEIETGDIVVAKVRKDGPCDSGTESSSTGAHSSSSSSIILAATENDPYAKIFSYDFCFGEDSSQSLVYTSALRPLVRHAFQGFNVCVFAYGQTGSGKTYTMMGTDSEVGISIRTCNDIFTYIEDELPIEVAWSLSLSFYEVYNEKVRDLLDDATVPKALRVREHPVTGPFVENLSRHTVTEEDSLAGLLRLGMQSRTVAETRWNVQSSRSHAIVSISLTQTAINTATSQPTETVSRITLVDLAGSEKWWSQGSDVTTRSENMNINKSLLTLGRVISCLSEYRFGQQDTATPTTLHIPYRDSVLTWLLKDSLGGNSRTLMIASVSPTYSCMEESINTLRYAERAKYIRNHAIVNKNEDVAVVEELKNEIKELRKKVHLLEESNNSSSVFTMDPTDMVQELNDRWETKMKAVYERFQLQLQEERECAQGVVVRYVQRVPYLLNLDPNPTLGDVMLYTLLPGTNFIRSDLDPVTQSSKEDLRLQDSHNIGSPHCLFEVDEKNVRSVAVTPLGGLLTYHNGKLLTKSVRVKHGDRFIFGASHVYLYVDLEAAKQIREKRKGVTNNTPRVLDWQYAVNELKQMQQTPLGGGAAAQQPEGNNNNNVPRSSSLGAVKSTTPTSAKDSSSSPSSSPQRASGALSFSDDELSGFRHTLHEFQFYLLQLFDVVMSADNPALARVRSRLTEDWIVSTEPDNVTTSSLTKYVKDLCLNLRECCALFVHAFDTRKTQQHSRERSQSMTTTSQPTTHASYETEAIRDAEEVKAIVRHNKETATTPYTSPQRKAMGEPAPQQGPPPIPHNQASNDNNMASVLKELNVMKSDFNSLIAKYTRLSEHVENLTVENDKMRSEHETASQEAAREKNDLLAHISHLKSVASKAMSLEMDIMSHPNVVRKMAEIDARHRAELIQERSKSAVANKRCEGLEAQNNALLTDVAKQKASLREYDGKVYDYQQQLNVLERELLLSRFRSEDLLRQCGSLWGTYTQTLTDALQQVKTSMYQTEEVLVVASHKRHNNLNNHGSSHDATSASHPPHPAVVVSTAQDLLKDALRCLRCHTNQCETETSTITNALQVEDTYKNLVQVLQTVLVSSNTVSKKTNLRQMTTLNVSSVVTDASKEKCFNAIKLLAASVIDDGMKIPTEVSVDIIRSRVWLVQVLKTALRGRGGVSPSRRPTPPSPRPDIIVGGGATSALRHATPRGTMPTPPPGGMHTPPMRTYTPPKKVLLSASSSTPFGGGGGPLPTMNAVPLRRVPSPTVRKVAVTPTTPGRRPTPPTVTPVVVVSAGTTTMSRVTPPKRPIDPSVLPVPRRVQSPRTLAQMLREGY